MVAQLAQNAVTGCGIGDMDKPPIANRNGVSAMLADDARIILVGPEIFLSNGRMKNRHKEFSIATVFRRRAGAFAKLKGVTGFQLEAAG